LPWFGTRQGRLHVVVVRLRSGGRRLSVDALNDLAAASTWLAPEKSLLLEKATGNVSHTGGQLFDESHDDYKTLLAWLKAGARTIRAPLPKPLGIELVPPKMVFGGDASDAANRGARRRYSDGSVRDVSRLALFMSNNESVASIGQGRVGEGDLATAAAFVFARFNKFTVGLGSDRAADDGPFCLALPPAHNYIDTLVFDKLRKLRMAPSELRSDETCLPPASTWIRSGSPPPQRNSIASSRIPIPRGAEADRPVAGRATSSSTSGR
jgi:hypothetical protein